MTMNVVRKTIVLRKQELMVRIGVHDHEKTASQRLIVSVEVDVADLAEENDKIDRTFDYDKIYGFIKSLESAAQIELQETVARRVLSLVLSCEGVIRAVVETRKPDVFEDVEYVGVRLEGVAGT
ncbi:dihydroneopterin aldolase [Aminobacter sp. MET-1]|uniref:dihydroneopterin aldolase n=1 Tax=Aminobacter sp. MET-1 TaxID=2951085 RepID=UPI00226A3756|nr:dihydroneopterin aldolase [Aminobacter sp. MET-1]MCX8571138.1 dihydroneopterin aldolase [Aminobacter sp. MET-1]MCX8573193.1 dihydroneopterin aldolase [Aminobacter sp. MET-1]